MVSWESASGSKSDSNKLKKSGMIVIAANLPFHFQQQISEMFRRCGSHSLDFKVENTGGKQKEK